MDDRHHPEERGEVAAYFGERLLRPPRTDLCTPSGTCFRRQARKVPSAPGRMAMCPSGHGDVMLRILRKGGSRLGKRRDPHIFYFRSTTRSSIGSGLPRYHIKNQCEASSKADEKRPGHERVGVFAAKRRLGLDQVIEHTELEPRGPRGVGSGGLALSPPTVARTSSDGVPSEECGKRHQLPFHAVPRATPYLGRRGRWSAAPTASAS
jgi:hypothetical protein